MSTSSNETPEALVEKQSSEEDSESKKFDPTGFLTLLMAPSVDVKEFLKNYSKDKVVPAMSKLIEKAVEQLETYRSDIISLRRDLYNTNEIEERIVDQYKMRQKTISTGLKNIERKLRQCTGFIDESLHRQASMIQDREEIANPTNPRSQPSNVPQPKFAVEEMFICFQENSSYQAKILEISQYEGALKYFVEYQGQSCEDDVEIIQVGHEHGKMFKMDGRKVTSGMIPPPSPLTASEESPAVETTPKTTPVVNKNVALESSKKKKTSATKTHAYILLSTQTITKQCFQEDYSAFFKIAENQLKIAKKNGKTHKMGNSIILYLGKANMVAAALIAHKFLVCFLCPAEKKAYFESNLRLHVGTQHSKYWDSVVDIPELSTETGEASSTTCRQQSENALEKMSENYQRSDRESRDEVEKFAFSGPLELKTKCIFCGVFGHESVNCLRFASSHQRSLKLADQNICEKCLGWKHENQDECPCKEVICQPCVVKWPELKGKVNHHPVVCYSNAMPHIPKIALIPKEDPTETICIFCIDPGHESMYCRKFSTSFQRRRALKNNKLCLRCLEWNNVEDGSKHIPCPKDNEACPNCVDIWPGKRSETHHHVLVCHWIPLPDKLQKQNNICKK